MTKVISTIHSWVKITDRALAFLETQLCSQIRGVAKPVRSMGIRCFDKDSQKLIEDFDNNNANLNNAGNNARR